MEILKKIDLNTLECILIDGHVYINNSMSYGLGGHLWESLQQKIPIIGVAKKAFHTNSQTVILIIRGNSKQPLFISSIDLDNQAVAEQIKNMQGNFRIPTLLKYVDTLTKENN